MPESSISVNEHEHEHEYEYEYEHEHEHGDGDEETGLSRLVRNSKWFFPDRAAAAIAADVFWRE